MRATEKQVENYLLDRKFDWVAEAESEICVTSRELLRNYYTITFDDMCHSTVHQDTLNAINIRTQTLLDSYRYERRACSTVQLDYLLFFLLKRMEREREKNKSKIPKKLEPEFNGARWRFTVALKTGSVTKSPNGEYFEYANHMFTIEVRWLDRVQWRTYSQSGNCLHFLFLWACGVHMDSFNVCTCRSQPGTKRRPQKRNRICIFVCENQNRLECLQVNLNNLSVFVCESELANGHIALF